MTTHYETLGVLPTAPLEVIKAAYKTLVNIYHPDKYKGDKEFAHAKTSELNKAYNTLKDAKRRANYDEQVSNSSSSDEDETIFDDKGTWEFAEFEKDWCTATEFLPHLNQIVTDLKKISLKLAFVYKACLLHTKSFNNAEKIAGELKSNFLSLYFGNNTEIQRYAQQLIYANRRDIALELNRAVKVLGSSVNSSDITQNLDLKHSIPAVEDNNILKSWNGQFFVKTSGHWMKFDSLEAAQNSLTTDDSSSILAVTLVLMAIIAIIAMFV